MTLQRVLWTLLTIVFLTACGKTSISTQTITPELTPTRTRLPAPTPQLILQRDKAIAYSYNLLLERDLEQGFDYDNANLAVVEFPNGDKGVFIAIGFCCHVRGYQFLYRIRDNQVQLIQLLADDWDWGKRTLASNDKAETTFLQLYHRGGHWVQTLKVTAAGHLGSGLGAEGYFQIIEIADDGIKVVFEGSEYNIIAMGEGCEDKFRYSYEDLDADGNREIVEEGEDCNWVYDTDRKVIVVSNCKRIDHVYQFNGDKYVVLPEREYRRVNPLSCGTR